MGAAKKIANKTESIPANKIAIASASDLRLGYLDGLRGWASILVLFSHLAIFALANKSPISKAWIFGFLSDANFAIFIFFVLSGLVLSNGYLRTGNPELLTGMVLRRYLRLFIPIFCSSMLAYTLKTFDLFYNQQAGIAFSNEWLKGFYNNHMTVWQFYKFVFYDVFFHHNPTTTLNPVLWTMGLELMGSFIVFAICALVMKTPSRLVILAAIFSYFMIEKNIWYSSFIAGMFLSVAELYRNHRISKALGRLWPVALIAVAYYSASSLRGPLFSFLPAIRHDYLNLAGAMLLVFYAGASKTVQGFFENRFSKYLGTISFPLYLTHFLVLCSFSSYFALYLQNLGLGIETASTINFVVSTAVCFLVAHLFRSVEDYAITASKEFSDLMLNKQSNIGKKLRIKVLSLVAKNKN
jgi:peptidoglycan/LPS O-acetylase OafA/YrhL